MVLHLPNIDEVFSYESIDSTNLEAHRRRVEFSQKNILYHSNIQTAGRGQRGRNWESRADLGLWMTLFLGRPLDLKHNLQLLSIYSGLVMQNVLAKLSGIDITLKWPNDIMINDQKCGGILSEVQWMGSTASSAIIGIGLNLKHGKEDFSSPISLTATSLLEAGWFDVDKDTIVQHFIDQFFNQLDLLDQPEVLAKSWNSVAYKIHGNIEWLEDDQILQAKFMGIDLHGAAQLKFGQQTRSFRNGEIRMKNQ